MSATTRIDVARGVGENAAGDEVDLPLAPVDAVPAADEAAFLTPRGGIPATLVERKRTELDAAKGTVRTVRYIAARFTDRLGSIRVGDLVRDRRTGRIYPVTGIAVVSTIAGSRQVRCDLEGTLSE